MVCSFTENTPNTHVIPNSGSRTSKFQTDDLKMIEKDTTLKRNM